MANLLGDISAYRTTASTTAAASSKGKVNVQIETKSDKLGLDMTGFLQLMLAQFENQSIDDTADTSEMLNQMVQMQMIDAIVNMTDATVMSYAASLVGKEVTVATYDAKGVYHEVVGEITATGTMNGEQVIFIGDECYRMNQILAIGRLPEKTEAPDEGDGDDKDPVDPIDPENPDNPTDPVDPEAPENPENPTDPVNPENPSDPPESNPGGSDNPDSETQQSNAAGVI